MPLPLNLVILSFGLLIGQQDNICETFILDSKNVHIFVYISYILVYGNIGCHVSKN